MGVGKFPGQGRSVAESSVLLELAALDDLIGFRKVVEEEGVHVDEGGLWYGRRLGSKKIGLEERTPLMVASMFGSKQVLMYILETGNVNVNRACGSDAATALHCAVVGGSANVVDVVSLLLDASANVNCIDVGGNRPFDLIIPSVSSLYNSRRKMLQLMLNGYPGFDKAFNLNTKISEDIRNPHAKEVSSLQASGDCNVGRDYFVDFSRLDIKNKMYVSDEFRMYAFKIKPCLRAYTHDWTECPFAHPGEYAKRRDPRTFHYSCVPCPEFRKGNCPQRDTCIYAHGIFECWLHPAQYRTRLCKDKIGCNRKVCFFAHKLEELRPSCTSTGSGVPSHRSFRANSSDFSTMSPLTLGSPSVMMPPSGQSTPMDGSMGPIQCNFASPNLGLSGSRLRTTLSAKDMDLEAKRFGKEGHRRHQQQILDELSCLSSQTAWNNPFSSCAIDSQGHDNAEPRKFSGLKPTKMDDVFKSHDPAIMSYLQGHSFDGRLHCSDGISLPSFSSERDSWSNFKNIPATKTNHYGIEE